LLTKSCKMQYCRDFYSCVFIVHVNKLVNYKILFKHILSPNKIQTFSFQTKQNLGLKSFSKSLDIWNIFHYFKKTNEKTFTKTKNYSLCDSLSYIINHRIFANIQNIVCGLLYNIGNRFYISVRHHHSLHDKKHKRKGNSSQRIQKIFFGNSGGSFVSWSTTSMWSKCRNVWFDHRTERTWSDIAHVCCQLYEHILYTFDCAIYIDTNSRTILYEML